MKRRRITWSTLYDNVGTPTSHDPHPVPVPTLIGHGPGPEGGTSVVDLRVFQYSAACGPGPDGSPERWGVTLTYRSACVDAGCLDDATAAAAAMFRALAAPVKRGAL